MKALMLHVSESVKSSCNDCNAPDKSQYNKIQQLLKSFIVRKSIYGCATVLAF